MQQARSRRRRFLQRSLGAGASLGLGSLLGSCVSGAPRPAVDALDLSSGCPGDPPGPGLDGPLDVAGLPFRQDDPAWANDLMWDRALVIRADTELNGHSRAEAESLLREFDDGNTVGNEGCLLTSLAMVLRLLVPRSQPPWTPGTLNAAAQELRFYTPSGLSMTTLYADLVSEVSAGSVQLCAKEEYLAGEPSWPRAHANTAALVRAYRSLSPLERSGLLLVLKTGTYDDTVASHYVLLHPNSAEPPDGQDPEILDPARPPGGTGSWRLSDSARLLATDPDIAKAWAKARIEPTQVGGAWAFSRRREAPDRSRMARLLRAWADELASPR